MGLSFNRFIYNDSVCKRHMLQDIKVKHDFIVGGSGMVLDLAEIVASYCQYL
jgi:hypothetical protein